MPKPKYKSIQCGATTVSQARCKRRTIATSPYCYQHARSVQGLQVKKSKIPQADKGLFAAREFKKDERIGEYTGKRTVAAPADMKTNDYIAEVKTKAEGIEYIDGKDPTKSGILRYANDCRAQNKECSTNNSKFYYHREPGPKPRNRRHKPINPNKTRMYVKATRKIKKGSEIYLGYGADYWRYQKQRDALKAKAPLVVKAKRAPKAKRIRR